MRFLVVYLIAYFGLVGGALLALGRAGVLHELPAAGVAVAVAVAVVLGLAVALTSSRRPFV